MSYEFGFNLLPEVSDSDVPRMMEVVETVPEVARVSLDQYGIQLVLSEGLSSGNVHGDAQLNIHRGGLILAIHYIPPCGCGAIVNGLVRALEEAKFEVTEYEV